MGYVIGPCLQGPTERLRKWDILWVTECMGYYRYGSLELTIQLYCILEWSYQVNIQTPPVKSGARHEWRKNGSSGSFKHQSPTIHTSTDWLRAQKGKTHILVPSRIISTALFPLCSNTLILEYENLSYHGYLSPICQVNERTGDVLLHALYNHHPRHGKLKAAFLGGQRRFLPRIRIRMHHHNFSPSDGCQTSTFHRNWDNIN